MRYGGGNHVDITFNNIMTQWHGFVVDLPGRKTKSRTDQL